MYGAAHGQETAGLPAKRPSFWQAISGLAAINGLTWFYNWHIQRWDWADVGTRSWWANLQGGFTWDDDAYGANQVAHPYHGSLYFSSARASGYNFWGSAPFVGLGSLTWELFTENVHPSINDLINTTLGGIALGEVSYRMSSLFTASRRGAASRQMGAFIVSPVAEAQSILHGRSRGEVVEGPESSSARLSVGQRRSFGGPTDGGAGAHPFLGLGFQYGSVFDDRVRRPYDAFEFSLHLSPNEHVVLTHASISGLLARRELSRTSRNQLILGLYQHYDYDDLPLTKASSQSLSGAVLYRQNAGRRTQIDVGLHMEVVPLGAVSTDYDVVRRRDYDFGPGLGARFTGAIRHDGRELLRVDGRTMWIHSLYATDADHLTTTARISATVPVVRMVSVGGDVGWTIRQSMYQDQPRVTRKFPQFRAYLAWSPN
jgi:hypothetical protein